MNEFLLTKTEYTSFHRSTMIQAAAEQFNIQFHFLPPYSPI